MTPNIYAATQTNSEVIRAERVKFTRMADMARCKSISLAT